MEKLKKIRVFNAFELKLLAMALMLCDHMWATVIPGAQWLTNIGRLAFPIFAFQIVEGYFHTHDFKTYLGRMFLFALISEIPFNLMHGGAFYPFAQNVMFTFVLALLMLRLLDWAKTKRAWVFWVMLPVVFILSMVLGFATFVDYYGFGILMVVVFYLAQGKPWGFLLELVGMYIINVEMMGGQTFPVELFGTVFDVSQQGLAMLALIPIWLYNGKQGPHSKAIQYACYAFYPVHILVLSLLALCVL